MEALLKYALVGFVVATILSGIFLGLRSSALKSAYDSTNTFTVTDSNGTVHTIQATGVSGDIVGLIWAIMAGLVWLIYVAGAVFMLIKQVK